MARVLVLMTSNRGANFRGEKCYFDGDKASQLVQEKACVLLDENGEPIIPEAGVIEGNDNAGGNTDGEGNTEGGKARGSRSKGKKTASSQPNPFEIDGFDAKIVAALAEAGINNPEELRAYVDSGKSLAELPVIGIVTEKELLDLYGG
jgi:hypothetical protein